MCFAFDKGQKDVYLEMGSAEQIKSEYEARPHPWESCYDHVRNNPQKRYIIKKRKTKEPIYEPDRVKYLARNPQNLVLTRNAYRKLSCFEMNLSKLSDIICSYLEGCRYKKSEWCHLDNENDWYAADAYVLLKVSYSTHPKNAQKIVDELYLKVSISKIQKICTISLHL